MDCGTAQSDFFVELGFIAQIVCWDSSCESSVIAGGMPTTRPKAAPCRKAGTIRSRTRLWRWTAPTRATRLAALCGDLGDDAGPGRAAESEPESRRDRDRELCKLRNEVERLFRRLKGCRRIHTRFDKRDMMFPGFLHFAVVVGTICDLA